MKVWIVTAGFEYEAWSIEGVYTNPKSAYAKKQEVERRDPFIMADVDEIIVSD